MVLLAIKIPSPFKISMICLSVIGFLGFSPEIISFILLFTLSIDSPSSLVEEILLVKKNFNSNTPLGVWIYFPFVTRLTVDS